MRLGCWCSASNNKKTATVCSLLSHSTRLQIVITSSCQWSELTQLGYSKCQLIAGCLIQTDKSMAISRHSLVSMLVRQVYVYNRTTLSAPAVKIHGWLGWKWQSSTPVVWSRMWVMDWVFTRLLVKTFRSTPSLPPSRNLRETLRLRMSLCLCLSHSCEHPCVHAYRVNVLVFMLVSYLWTSF